MDIKEVQNQIVEEFKGFSDWMDKYSYLIELGNSIPLIDEKYKTETYLISGCQSRVWLKADYREGKVFFTADSDAVITKGIASLLIRVFSGRTTDEIIQAPLDFIEQVGLKEHLSPTRSNGLDSMLKQIKMYAYAFKAKNE